VLTGTILSHAAHWLSVILLWSIARISIDSKSVQRSSLAFVAATLHIISPAGIFLSAPYGEGLFSCLNMLGFYLYISHDSPEPLIMQKTPVRKLLAGMAFGLATMIRSNGLLSGLPFLLDAMDCLLKLLSSRVEANSKPGLLIDLLFIILGGSCIAVGLVIPQFIAYQEYCVGQGALRPRCSSLPPSIFTWVQSHYW
jgi:phosphatidylinositol glycan class V